MSENAAEVVMCEGCGRRAAEIVADDGRDLCGECYLEEGSDKTPRKAKTKPDA